MPRPVSALQFLQVRHRAWPPRALIGTCSSVTVLPEDAWSRAKPVRQIGQAVLPRSYKRSRLLLPVFRDMPHDKIWVYPDFPTIFRGFSEFFVGDLMGKALWKLVENAQRFPRRGGRVLCVHGPVSFHRARPCATKWPPRRGLRTGPPASSDCGRPVNDKCSHQHRRSVQAERSSCPGKTVISGTYAIWETRI